MAAAPGTLQARKNGLGKKKQKTILPPNRLLDILSLLT